MSPFLHKAAVPTHLTHVCYWGVKRTCRGHAATSESDPTETLGCQICCDAQRGFSWDSVVACDPRLRGAHMRRREFITLLGGAAAWPFAAWAQQKRIPRLCFLTFDPGTLRTRSPRFDGFFQGLQELGYVNARNIEISYLSADNNGDRFPALIDECLSSHAGRHRCHDHASGAPLEEGNPRHPHCHGSSRRSSRDRGRR